MFPPVSPDRFLPFKYTLICLNALAENLSSRKFFPNLLTAIIGLTPKILAELFLRIFNDIFAPSKTKGVSFQCRKVRADILPKETVDFLYNLIGISEVMKVLPNAFPPN